MKLNKAEVANRLRSVLDETEAHMINLLDRLHVERITELKSYVNDHEKHLAEVREQLEQLEASIADNLAKSQEELAVLVTPAGKEEFFRTTRENKYSHCRVNSLQRDIQHIKETLNFLDLVDGDTITVREADGIMRNVMGVLKVRW